VVDDSKVDKDNEKQPSTSAQLSTVEAEGPVNFPENADNKTDEHNNDAHDGNLAATEDCCDCAASDESVDEEDPQIFESTADGQEPARDNEDVTDYWRRRTTDRFRYEVNFWYYHLREAEELCSWDEILSSPAWVELRSELDHFIHNVDFFKRW
jgi:hypothetical protein